MTDQRRSATPRRAPRKRGQRWECNALFDTGRVHETRRTGDRPTRCGSGHGLRSGMRRGLCASALRPMRTGGGSSPPRSGGYGRPVGQKRNRAVGTAVADGHPNLVDTDVHAAAEDRLHADRQAVRRATRAVATCPVVVMGRAMAFVLGRAVAVPSAGDILIVVMMVLMRTGQRDRLPVQVRGCRRGVSHHRQQSQHHEQMAENPHGRPSFVRR